MKTVGNGLTAGRRRQGARRGLDGVDHQILTPLYIGTIHNGQEQVISKIEQ